MERYPDGTTVTIDDFKKCGWREVLSEAHRDRYSSFWQAFSKAASRAIESGKLPEGKILWLLADACSMQLKGNSLNEPFMPFWIMNGKRSVLPEDFQEEDITFFKKIVHEINDPKLCARISDMIWLLDQPRDPQYALSAIDNYCKIPINTECWIGDGGDCWRRAIQLCLMLKKGAGDRLKQIEKEIVVALKRASVKDTYLVLWLAELLSKHRLGISDQVNITEKLEDLANKFENNGDYHRSRDYFDAASEGYKRLDNPDKSSEMIMRNAECWVKEAIARQTSDAPSHMVAATFYENAIHKYRTIPKALRGNHNVDERIHQLRNEMNEAGERSLGEMSEVATEPIDITKLIENAIAAVQGKDVLDALLLLSNVHHGARVDRLQKFSQKMRSKYICQTIFPSTQISGDGRVIAKQSGADLASENIASLRPEMIKNYGIEVLLAVRGSIYPALEVMRQEHRIKEVDFYSIVMRSPIIPPNGKRLMAKALYMGYDDDFVSALHLLVPQIESMVRYHLKQNGVITTTIDASGIENENGLSSLMESDETIGIFGKDLSFELKSLFCDPFGPNLRNKLAHGLVGFEESQSIDSVYAWWLCLRIVFNTFWNTRQSGKQ